MVHRVWPSIWPNVFGSMRWKIYPWTTIQIQIVMVSFFWLNFHWLVCACKTKLPHAFWNHVGIKMHLTISILFICFENHTIQSCCNCNPMCPQCSHALCSQFLLQQLLWHWTLLKEDMAYRNTRVTLDARSFCLTRRI